MVRLRGRSRDEDAPRRSTRARRSARTRTPSDVSEDDSDVYSEDERPRARRGRRVTPRDATSEEDDAADEDAEVVEVEGREYRIEDDALVLDTDPAGERKVDAAGHLQGGRTYRVPTFTSPERSDPNRLYMLSIDVARVLGFRDSGYFFRKNPLLHKVLLSTEERDALVADGRLSGPTRNVTMVVARSVFMLMGARIITRGRMVTDDYYEAQARANGCKEGAPVAMPSIEEILRAERRRESDRERERGRRRPDAATHTTIDPQGEAVVTTFGDAGHSPFERAGPWAQRRALLQRADLTEENWMAEYARSVRAMNAEILACVASGSAPLLRALAASPLTLRPAIRRTQCSRATPSTFAVIRGHPGSARRSATSPPRTSARSARRWRQRRALVSRPSASTIHTHTCPTMR